MCLNTFLSGLKEPLGSNIRSMRPKTLAEALSFCIQEQNIYYTKKPFTNSHPVPQQNVRHFPTNFQSYPLSQHYHPMVNNQYRPSHQFPRQYYQNIPPYQTNMVRYQNPTNNAQNPHINAPVNTFGQNKNFNTYQKNIPNNGLEHTRTFYNNNKPNFEQQQYRSQNLPPAEPMDVSSGYTHLRKPPSMQTQRVTSSINPHEIHNINTDGNPYTNLEEYYYYQQDNMYTQNDYSQDFTLEQVNQYDQHISNTIDDSQNFLLNASPDQQDT